MYSRIIDGKEYTFGVSGKLIMNVLVMYDRQTGSLWSQLLGEAVYGPLSGSKLEFLPAWQTTWADWKKRHPDTLALVKGYRGSIDPYAGYYASNDPGVIGETISDDRLYVKEFVIGVEHENEPVAYPFSVLNDQPVVNDVIGDLPILVVFNADTGDGVVFEREVDGQVLDFKLVSDFTLRDAQTSSTWDGRTGEATAGPLASQQLQRVKSTRSFWFGWKDFYPETRIYGVDP